MSTGGSLTHLFRGENPRYSLVSKRFTDQSMIRHRFNLAALISLCLFVLVVFLCISTLWLNPWDHYISLTPQLNIAVIGDDTIGRVVIFNDDAYGPYRGSMIDSTTVIAEHHFGDTAGIYFRYFRWSTGTLWTLMASFWYPAVLFGVLPLIWIVTYRKTDSGEQLCPACHYDCRASPERCPECGEELATGS